MLSVRKLFLPNKRNTRNIGIRKYGFRVISQAFPVGYPEFYDIMRAGKIEKVQIRQGNSMITYSDKKGNIGNVEVVVNQDFIRDLRTHHVDISLLPTIDVRTKDLLNNNRKLLHIIANKLIKDEKFTNNDIAELMTSHDIHDDICAI